MIAPLYHAHHAPYQEDLPFWLDLARRSGGPVLELGCGTGRVLIPLLEAGFRAVGLDSDREMLRFLHSLSPSAPVLQADMAAFHLAASFSLIILPCNTLSSLPDATRLQVYAQVADHLHPGGRFAFSIANPALLAELPEIGEPELEETLTHPYTGYPVQVSSAWRRTPERFILSWHYDHLRPDGNIDRRTIETHHSLQPVEAYQRELEAAGLHLLETWGDFDRSHFNEDSPSWITLAGADD
jgi:SAM-dependent methyltransferase